MRDTASQVAPMRHITPTLTQPAFTSGSDETCLIGATCEGWLGQSQGNMSHQSHL
jgi:hypothetical protein